MDLFKHRSEVNRRSARDNAGWTENSTVHRPGRGAALEMTGFAGAVLAIALAMPPMSAVASTVATQSGEITYERLRRIQRPLDLQGWRDCF